MRDWKRIKDCIAKGKRFVVTSHIYPDGDAIGSTIALLRLLRAMRKSADAVIPSRVPAMLRFLEGCRSLMQPGEKAAGVISGADTIFILDASTDDRLGGLERVIRRADARTVCIDHHPGNSVTADLKIVDTSACSTAQMIYELYKSCGLRIDREAAEALYTGIHTDTVSFNFLGTTARTHLIAADLLERGVDPKKTWMRIYGTDSPSVMRLAGLALSKLRLADRGRIAWLTVARRQWRSLKVSPRDTETFTRYPLTVRGVGVIAVFCEETPDRVRVSLRALDSTDVGKLARAYGGGGHRTSAGATMRGRLRDIEREVIRGLKRAGRVT